MFFNMNFNTFMNGNNFNQTSTNNGENFDPEFIDFFVSFIFSFQIKFFDASQVSGKANCKGRENDVETHSKGELNSR